MPSWQGMEGTAQDHWKVDHTWTSRLPTGQEGLVWSEQQVLRLPREPTDWHGAPRKSTGVGSNGCTLMLAPSSHPLPLVKVNSPDSFLVACHRSGLVINLMVFQDALSLLGIAC